MNDQEKRVGDDEADKVSAGIGTHPYPRDPIRQGPPTHPGGPILDPIEPPKGSNPVG